MANPAWIKAIQAYQVNQGQLELFLAFPVLPGVSKTAFRYKYTKSVGFMLMRLLLCGDTEMAEMQFILLAAFFCLQE